MNSMDLKGITWVGNVYQKFESLCLEVEETMYQDTVKYVENQVQTVGASVKQFYSDVMQDLLPPSSADPAKVAAFSAPLEQYADAEIFRKPKVCIIEKPMNVDVEQLIEQSHTSGQVDKKAGNASGISGLCRSGDIVKGARSYLYSKQNNGDIVCKGSNVGIKDKPKYGNQLPSEMLGVITPIVNDYHIASSYCELRNENHEAAFDQSAMVSCSVIGRDSKKEGDNPNEVADVTNCTPDVLIDLPSSDMIQIGSAENKGMELQCISSSDGLSAESNDMLATNGVVSSRWYSLNGDTQQNESDAMEDCGRSEGWSTDDIESTDFIKPGVETIELMDKVKLEETCVMVDGEELPSFLHREGRDRSYKKKIRDAFSSKTRAARKQEYEQLAAKSEDINTGSSQNSAMPFLSMDSGIKKVRSHDFCESEWEFL